MIPPLIGITSAMWYKDDDEALAYNRLKTEYLQLLENHICTPVILPNIFDLVYAIHYCHIIDGLLLSGGDDIDPCHFDEENTFPASIIHPERDKMELKLAIIAKKNHIPVLGICRGIQVLNVAFGGNLYQDVSFRKNTNSHTNNSQTNVLKHKIIVEEPDRIFTKNEYTVNSTHHQIIKDVAKGFKVNAVAPDGVVEAISHINNDDFLVGVQWHPEMLKDDELTASLMEHFISRAKSKRADKTYRR